MAGTNKIFVNGQLPQVEDTDLNNWNNEINNAILSSLGLNYGDASQLAAAMSIMAADGDLYLATGTANAIILTALDITGQPRAGVNVLRDGTRVRFRAGSSNTTVVTVNVQGTGVRPVVKRDGAPLKPYEILLGGYYTLLYSIPLGSWILATEPNVSNLPLGVIVPNFNPDSAHLPNGFLHADGSAVSRTTYAGLFDRLGVAYGVGDGSTTFNLPDVRGYHLRYLDNGAGRDPNAGTRTARADGIGGDNVGTTQDDAFESHIHGIGTNDTNSGSTSNVDHVGKYNGVTYNVFSQAVGGSETRGKNIYGKALISAY